MRICAAAMRLPPYVCAILRCVNTGCLLVEERPPIAKTAAGSLTCFGGKLEAGEQALDGLMRELLEELDWQGLTANPDCRPLCGR